MSTIHGQPERIAGAVRTSAETAPHSQEPEPMHQQTENAAEDPHSRSRSEARATPRRNHSPRSRHKTRRALYRCISGQILTAGANDPQNAIHGAGANRANLPRWTEAHRTPLKRHISHTEPFLSILRTFTHKQINRTQNVKIALTPTKLIGESIQSISRRS